MLIELLSLFTAFCYGLNAVLTRKGMRGSNPMTGTIIASLVQFLMLSAILLISPPSQLIWMGIGFFVASGILASALGRLCNYMSIDRLGVPYSAPIIGSSPLFSLLFAFLLIGEEVTFPVIFGTILVVIGIVLTSTGDSNGGFSLRASDLYLPILAAAFYGASSAVRKIGLNILPEPVLGAMVGAAASLVIFAGYLAVTRGIGSVKLPRGSLIYFIASGFIISLGWLSMFTALMLGQVSVVSTLIGANPLFSLLFSWLMLRSSEGFGWRVVAGCLTIVSGVSIITLF